MASQDALAVVTGHSPYEPIALMSLAYGGFQIRMNSTAWFERGQLVAGFELIATAPNGKTLTGESWNDLIAKIDAAK